MKRKSRCSRAYDKVVSTLRYTDGQNVLHITLTYYITYIPCKRASWGPPWKAGRAPRSSAAPRAVAPRTPCRTAPAVAGPGYGGGRRNSKNVEHEDVSIKTWRMLRIFSKEAFLGSSSHRLRVYRYGAVLPLSPITTLRAYHYLRKTVTANRVVRVLPVAWSAPAFNI